MPSSRGPDSCHPFSSGSPERLLRSSPPPLGSARTSPASVFKSMTFPTTGQHHRRDQDAQIHDAQIHDARRDGDPDPSAGAAMSFLQRVDHLTWAWFTLPMSTGGLALVLAAQPHTFRGLTTIGTVVFLCTVAVFLTLSSLIAVRFARTPSALGASLRNPKESLFQPAFAIAAFTILGGVQRYGRPACGPWLAAAMRVLFWVYTAATVLAMLAHYYALFGGRRIGSKAMTPALVLAVFPPMLSGTLASLIAADQPPRHRVPVVVAGVTLQGLGFLVSLLVNAAYVVRMLDAGFPPVQLRPSMFVAVGPPAFTTLALLGIADALPAGYGYFARYPAAAEVIPPLALTCSVFIWTLGVWFLFMAVVGCVSVWRELRFSLAWYAFVFPNSGLVISVIALGNAMDSEGVRWVASVLTVVLVAVFVFVVGMNVKAVLAGEIAWPGKDEDS